MQTSQFTVSSLVQATTLYFRIPPIYVDTRAMTYMPASVTQDPSFALTNVTYCVSAIDMYNAISSLCQTLQGVNNKLSFLLDYSQMANYLANLTYAGNVTNILFGSNVIFQSMQPPARPNT